MRHPMGLRDPVACAQGVEKTLYAGAEKTLCAGVEKTRIEKTRVEKTREIHIHGRKEFVHLAVCPSSLQFAVCTSHVCVFERERECVC